MIYPLALLAAIAGTTLAQDASTTVVSLTLPLLDIQTIHASVVTTVGDATSYILACPSGTPSDECGIPGEMEFLQGPGTLSWHFSQMSADTDCKVTSEKATCSGYIVNRPSGTGAPVTSTLTAETISDLGDLVMPVTVTAGLENLKPGSKPSGSDQSSQPTNTGSTSTSSSTGGVPRMTQQAVLAGIAALAGGAMMI